MELPKDPMVLFSVINMKLRDCYSSLDELCEDMDVSREDIVSQLKAAGFEYSAEHNKDVYKRQARSPLTGIVSTHAVMRLLVTPQRTADKRLVAPTPIIAPVIV